MNLDEFNRSLLSENPPDGLAPPLRGLWFAAKGDWSAAHSCVQGEGGEEAAWVHAYLHRQEGDDANAAYWYRRAGRAPGRGSLGEEWRAIATALAA